MTDQPNWQREVAAEFSGELAAAHIAVVSALLDDQPADVVRQFAAELILRLRAVRNLTQLIHTGSDPAQQTVLFHTIAQDGSTPVTAAEFADTVLAQLAEARQMLDMLRLYALALSEDQES